MTACSAVEAEVWRHNLAQVISVQTAAVASGRSHVIQLQSPLVHEMKSIGAAFGKPGSFVRRMSVHRSQTVGPTTDLNQVIIKNTQAIKDAIGNVAGGSSHVLPRSQSVATPSHVQTLAPRRNDRAKLETLLADVWSPPLPYPGMTMRRSEQLRGSANQVIRKLSMASITSTFYSSKRRGSHTNMTKLQKDADSSRMTLGRENAQENMRPTRLPLSQLLPADFDLREQPSKQKRRNALRALTMTMERPFSPLLGSAAESSELKHSQSVREHRKTHTFQGRDDNLRTDASDHSEKSTLQPRLHAMDASHNAQTTALLTDVSPLDINKGSRALPSSGMEKMKSKSRLWRLFG